MTKLLIVEDDQLLQGVYKEVFDDVNEWQTVIVGDGAQALSTLKTLVPDVVLLDLMMPKVTGFDVLHAMRENAKFKNTIIIVSTNIFADKQELFKNGANEVLLKVDYTPKQLLDKVRSLLPKTS